MGLYDILREDGIIKTYNPKEKTRHYTMRENEKESATKRMTTVTRANYERVSVLIKIKIECAPDSSSLVPLDS